MPRRSWVEQIMGMPISVHLRGPGVSTGPGVARVVAAVFEQLRQVDHLMSTYRADSEVIRHRRGELTLSRCHPWVREVVELCEQARLRTDGYFDARLPGGFDPSGLVKGWAVERAARLLAGIDACDYYLNAGGDIALGVAAPDAPGWRVGIEDPRDPTRILAVREARCGGVATSGSAARGAHIVDPHTGRRPDDLLAVTLIGPTLLWADVYATAAFARGADALHWLRTHAPAYEALVVYRDGRAAPADGADQHPEPPAWQA
ncbi:FAD:protein FMN transferase [Pseudonocardia aurantiaca]|uniref:FAD:protein FMN transferase n=1 Tax=Pseudonocardia aurantiaca TaxID=75290 RepID=A0ABW4FKL7_9PSEU